MFVTTRLARKLVTGASLAVIPFWLLAPSLARAAAVSPATAIAEFNTLCARDQGHLWGQNLCGPLLLVDAASRRIVANQNTRDGSLKRDADIYTGVLPPDVGIANTSTEWQGTRWIMVMLPLPTDQTRRDELLMHESFHRIQPSRLPPPPAPLPEHLATLEGRVSMRLEWRALAKALSEHGQARKTAVRDALAFRQWRRSRFPDAAASENALEINEGLAEYTGKRLGNPADSIASALKALADYDHRDAYVRSFAYASGPAYGLLLDIYSPGWRTRLRPDSDLGAMLHEAIGNAPLPSASSVRGPYGYAGIAEEETQAKHVRDQAAAKWKSKLVDGDTLKLPLLHVQMEFNPQNLFPLPPFGIVYPTAVLHDDWGTLTVDGGLLVSTDGKTATVDGAFRVNDGTYTGPGWTLRIAPGWAISAGSLRHAAPGSAASAQKSR
ncbi:hypothetical protein GCM10007863_25400 [Dyella mobilis]|nr:hypothetical protein GCM10007863_25400 [Dyella mobilis]